MRFLQFLNILEAAKTVKELLNENNIALSKKDRIRPALNKPLKEGTKVVVERVETRKEKKTEEIAEKRKK